MSWLDWWFLGSAFVGLLVLVEVMWTRVEGPDPDLAARGGWEHRAPGAGPRLWMHAHPKSRDDARGVAGAIAGWLLIFALASLVRV